jgi:hypothetical protein
MTRPFPVKRAIFTMSRSLPISPDERIFSERVGVSQRPTGDYRQVTAARKSRSRAVPLENVKRQPGPSSGSGTFLILVSPPRSYSGAVIGRCRCHWHLGPGLFKLGLFKSDVAARPCKIVGATGRRRQRLAFDQDPRCQRIGRRRPRPRATEQLIGAD